MAARTDFLILDVVNVDIIGDHPLYLSLVDIRESPLESPLESQTGTLPSMILPTTISNILQSQSYYKEPYRCSSSVYRWKYNFLGRDNL